MTNEEIDAVVARLEKSLNAGLFTASKVAYLFSGVSAPFVFMPGTGVYLGVFAALMACIGFLANSEAEHNARHFKAHSALLLWREWSMRETLNERGQSFLATTKMREAIEKIYEADPRGEVFPPKQAIRLVDTFNRQQERLETVESHLEGLRQTRQQLLEKAARLRELGDGSRDVSATLSRVEADLPALETLAGEIRASCLRLEALLIAVQTAAQVKQLHQELDEITSNVAPGQPIVPAQSDDLQGIEAQITREVETFLRLERDTDAHLRQL